MTQDAGELNATLEPKQPPTTPESQQAYTSPPKYNGIQTTRPQWYPHNAEKQTPAQ